MSGTNADLCKYCYPLVVGAEASCELHAEITTLRAQLEEARAKAIEEFAPLLTAVNAVVSDAILMDALGDFCSLADLDDAYGNIRSLIAGSTK